MTTPHYIKKARKDYPLAGIAKGDSYYKWSFRFGGTHRSLTRPPRSALTQSAFFSTLWDLQDNIPTDDIEDQPSAEAACSDVADAIRQLGEESQESLDNMPEGLQEGDTGQLLSERVEACDSTADEIEGIDTDFPEKEDFVDDDDPDAFDDACLERAQQIHDAIEEALSNCDI